jgi:zinc D-Ala-D-Ala carboxypeptidase
MTRTELQNRRNELQNIELSPNFTMWEYLRSTTAESRLIREQFFPDKQILDNLILCNPTHQQARNIMNRGVVLSSAYRCSELNRIVGGVANSEHLQGLGFDVVYSDIPHALLIAETYIGLGCKRIGLGKGFIHVGFSKTHPQNVVFAYGSATHPQLLSHQNRLRLLMK